MRRFMLKNITNGTPNTCAVQHLYTKREYIFCTTEYKLALGTDLYIFLFLNAFKI